MDIQFPTIKEANEVVNTAKQWYLNWLDAGINRYQSGSIVEFGRTYFEYEEEKLIPLKLRNKYKTLGEWMEEQNTGESSQLLSYSNADYAEMLREYVEDWLFTTMEERVANSPIDMEPREWLLDDDNYGDLLACMDNIIAEIKEIETGTIF